MFLSRVTAFQFPVVGSEVMVSVNHTEIFFTMSRDKRFHKVTLAART